METFTSKYKILTSIKVVSNILKVLYVQYGIGTSTGIIYQPQFIIFFDFS